MKPDGEAEASILFSKISASFSAARAALPMICAAVVCVVVAGAAVATAAPMLRPRELGGSAPQPPAVSGSRVVWADRQGVDYDIYLWDGATQQVTRLTTGGGDELQPSISGTRVVWTSFGAAGSDIKGMDVVSGDRFTVTSAAGDQVGPVISGLWVAWQDVDATWKSSSIRTAHLSALGTVLNVDTGGGRLVAEGSTLSYEVYPRKTGYPRYSPGDSNVRVYDFASKAKQDVFASTAHQVPGGTDGRYVVWSEWSASGSGDVFAVDLTNPGTRISVATGAMNENSPVICGTTVYYLSGSSATGTHVEAYDLTTRRYLKLANAADATALSAGNGGVAWLKHTSTGWRVYGIVPTSRRAPGIPRAAVRDGRRGSGVPGGRNPRIGTPAGETPPAPRSMLVDTIQPTIPAKVLARPSGTANVRIWWNPSADSGGSGVAGYDVYRHTATISASGSNITTDGQPVRSDNSNVVPGALVASGVTTTWAEVAQAVGELAGKFTTHYYAVRARDGAGNTSSLSSNAIPDPHGTLFVLTNCQRCHGSVPHGGVGGTPANALGAKSARACYTCHGATSADMPPDTTSYGWGSTLDIQGRNGEDDEVWGGLGDPVGGGSLHRNSTTSLAFNECDMCHATHQKPYDSDPTLGFSKLLVRWEPSINGYVYYRSDGQVVNAAGTVVAASFDTDFCLSCHGSSSGHINDASIGGPLAYANSAGDHAQAGGYEAGAHGPVEGSPTWVADSPNPRTVADGPSIACTACHDEHGSPNRGLISYRGTRDVSDGFAGVCYRCHSASGSTGELASGTASGTTNFAWNGRDVSAEFKRASTHPTVPPVPPIPQSGSVVDDTEVHFGGYTLSDTTVQGTGTAAYVRLASQGAGYRSQGTATSPLLSGSGTVIDEWTSLTVVGTEGGGTTITVDVLDGTSGTTFDAGLTAVPFTPPTMAIPLTTVDPIAHPTLRVRYNLSAPTPAPRVVSDTFDDNSFNGALWNDVFISANAANNDSLDPDATVFLESVELQDTFTSRFNSGSVLTGTWEYSTNFANGDNTTPTNYSVRGGSGTPAIDYRDTADLDLSGWTNLVFEADLYTTNLDTGEYVDIGYSTNAGSSWTYATPLQGNGSAQTLTDSSIAVSGPTAQTRFRIRVRDADNSEWGYFDDIRVYGTPPSTTWPKEAGQKLSLRAEGAGFSGTADSGEFLHVNSAVTTWLATGDFDARVRVDAVRDTLTSDSGSLLKAGLMVRTGSSDANAQASNAANVAMMLTSGGSNGAVYQSRATAGGTTVVTAAAASVTPPRWVRIVRSGTTLSGYVSVDGSAWTEVGTSSVTFGSTALIGIACSSSIDQVFSEADLDSFSVTEAVVAAATPQLDKATLAYRFIVPPSGAGLTCYNCHNTHFVKRGSTTSAWDVANRVSNPDDTLELWTGTTTQFCLTCHDSAAPTTFVDASALVPYTVSFRSAASWPFFQGWNKAGVDTAFTSSQHYAVAGVKALCENCHDPHGSNFSALTAWSRPSGFAAGNAATRANTTSAYSKEEALCYQCHGNGTVGKKLAAAPDIATPAGATYKHPVATADRHSSKESGTGGVGSANRHSECSDCHDAHAARAGIHASNSSAAGEALRGVVGVSPTWPSTNFADASGYTPVTIVPTGSDGYEAYLCFKCHTSYSGQPYVVTSSSGTTMSTNLAVEFNPANQSYHRVLGSRQSGVRESFVVGGTTYTFTFPTANVFDAGFTTTTMLTCTSCHSNTAAGQARGPHGSSARWMIDPAYPFNYRNAQLAASPSSANQGFEQTNVICNKCHNMYATGSPNTAHSNHNGRTNMDYCTTCHVSIPHGWKRPRLLGSTLDPQPYTVRPNGLIGIELMDHTDPNGWSGSDCGAECALSRHPVPTNPWP